MRLRKFRDPNNAVTNFRKAAKNATSKAARDHWTAAADTVLNPPVRSRRKPATAKEN